MSPQNVERFKGAAFREFLAWYEREHGRRGLEAACSTLAPEDRKLVDPRRTAMGVLHSSWYPASLVHHFVDAAIAGRSDDELDAMARQAARDTMEATIRGVYAFAFRLLGSPSAVARFLPRFWDMHYDSGTVEVWEEGPGHYRGSVRDWRGHHPFICLLNGYSNLVTYEKMGCRNVTVERAACVSHGDSACLFDTRWTVE